MKMKMIIDQMKIVIMITMLSTQPRILMNMIGVGMMIVMGRLMMETEMKSLMMMETKMKSVMMNMKVKKISLKFLMNGWNGWTLLTDGMDGTIINSENCLIRGSAAGYVYLRTWPTMSPILT